MKLKPTQILGACIALGSVFGGIVGVVVKHPGAFLGVGIAFGAIVGTVLSKKAESS
jgi:hypothetical protein